MTPDLHRLNPTRNSNPAGNPRVGVITGEMVGRAAVALINADAQEPIDRTDGRWPIDRTDGRWRPAVIAEAMLRAALDGGPETRLPT